MFLFYSLLLKVFSDLDILKKRRIQLFILLACLLALAESRCPYNCKCTSITISCMNRDIDRIPNFESINVDPITIDLSGNRISIIGKDDLHFSKSFMVKEVYLNDTNLIDIESEAFDEMENLQELYLGNNLLTSVPSDFIKGLYNMVLLDLSGNYFEGDMPVIESESLEVLTMLNCQITSITVESLKHLSNLKLLSLEQNNIHHIDTNAFESISTKWFLLKLPFNTWKCNCQTIKVLFFLSEYKYIDASEQYECQLNKTGIRIFKSNEFIEEFCELRYSNGQNQKVLGNDDMTPMDNNAKPYDLQKIEENTLQKEFENKNKQEAEYNQNLPTNSKHNEIDYLSISFFVLVFIAIAFVLKRLILVEYKNMNGSDSTTQLL